MKTRHRSLPLGLLAALERLATAGGYKHPSLVLDGRVREERLPWWVDRT
jgi:hypothetical protein